MSLKKEKTLSLTEMGKINLPNQESEKFIISNDNRLSVKVSRMPGNNAKIGNRILVLKFCKFRMSKPE